MFRARIVPATVALWGAAIVVRLLVTGTQGAGAHGAGQLTAAVIGLVMFVGGLGSGEGPGVVAPHDQRRQPG